jgi:hypothetical protein
LLFLLFGAVATWFARDYPMGSAVRMGPGYFPMVLGVLLLALGAITCAAGLALRGEAIERLRARPLVMVLAAVGVFAVAIEPAGIIVATVLSTALAAAASSESRAREFAILIVVLLGLAVGVFTYGLGLPFKLMPDLPAGLMSVWPFNRAAG